MSVWQTKAGELNGLYQAAPDTAKRQLRHQVRLIVFDEFSHKFFPIRRLVDGIENRPMGSVRSEAGGVSKYEDVLKAEGFVALRQGCEAHEQLKEELRVFLEKKFNCAPSRVEKTFWVKADKYSS